MRNLYLITGLALTLGLSAAHAQTPTWSAGVQTVNPTPTDDTRAAGRAIATDAAGNAYVAGVLNSGAGSGAPGRRSFGTTTLTTQGANLGSGFIGKLSAALQWQWAVRAGTNGEGAVFSRVCTSPSGDVYAAGTVDDDPFITPNGGSVLSVGSFTYTTTSAHSFFLTRLNANGQPQWLVGLPNVTVTRVGWDAVAGNVVVVGAYTGTLTIGSTTLPAAPRDGFFVARLSSAGTWLSAVGVALTNSTSSSSEIDMYTAAVGPQGQVAVNFQLRDGQVTLGSNTITTSTAVSRRIVVAQLSPAGQWQWATQATNSERYYSNDLEYDRTGALWMLGDAGSTTLQLGTSQVTNGYEFVARLSSAGAWQNSAELAATGTSGPSPGYTTSLAIDGQNNAVVAGELNAQTSTRFVDAAGVRTLSTGSVNRNFVARLGSDFLWNYAQLAPAASGSTSVAPPDYDISDTALDAAGNLLTTGLFTGTLAVGNTLTSSAYGDAYVAKLSNAGLPLGVRQAAGVAPLALYPNPATAGAAATLRLPSATTATLPLTLRDALGRVVRTGAVAAGRQEATVPTAGLTPGLYLLEAGPQRAQLVVE